MAMGVLAPIAIVGLGLIGGSLGLDLRALEQPPLVWGWDARPEVGPQAQARGAISFAAPTLAACVSEAALVILAVPVGALGSVLEAIAPHVQPGAIVTDVGSTKSAVSAWAAAILPAHAHFIGGHPMAGSEQHGIEQARAGLFRGARYCLTPTATTDPQALWHVRHLVERIGARPFVCSPEEHDRWVAAISHLPFMLSTVLVELAARGEWAQARELAATGFRDVGRLASGDVAMHRDICLMNTAELRPLLLAAAVRLTELAGMLDQPAALEEFFGTAKTVRDDWIAGRDGLNRQDAKSAKSAKNEGS